MAVDASYEAQLHAICRRIEAGDPPWTGPSAHLGPPQLSSGLALRSIAAIVAWHAADALDNHPMVWTDAGFVSEDDPTAVIGVPRRGQPAWTALEPVSWPSTLLDGPPRDLLGRTTDATLRARLHHGMGAEDADAAHIVCVARALLRAVGDAEPLRAPAPDGSWSVARLHRVAAWGQWLADALRAPGNSRPAPSRPADALRTGPNRAALPDELAATLPPRDNTPVQWIARTTRSRRPAILRWLDDPQDPTPFAARAFRLWSHVGHDPLPTEASAAWRALGRLTRDALVDGDAYTLLRTGMHRCGADRAGRLLHVLRRHHTRTCWFHPRSTARVQDLGAAAERWALDAGLSPFTHARAVDPVRLATLRSTEALPSEDEVRQAVGKELDWHEDDLDWAAIVERASAMPWKRSARRKRTGGLRWLDVPAPTLRQALRPLARLYAHLLPPNRTVTAFHKGASPALHAVAHAGARHAVKVDIQDFFGACRPRHLRPWLPATWSDTGREALIDLTFRTHGGRRYLPQGAPPSPPAANLAGLWVDHAVVAAAAKELGAGRFRYTRYADDLVLSTAHDDIEDFEVRALALLRRAVREQGFRLSASKTRIWSAGADPLHVCGLRVPHSAGEPLALDREAWRRARAAEHQMRTRRQAEARSFRRAHGTLAYAYAATGDPRWLAYTSGLVDALARAAAGDLYAEAFLAGWADA